MTYRSLSQTSLVTLLARVSTTSESSPAASSACLARASPRPLDVLARLRTDVMVTVRQHCIGDDPFLSSKLRTGRSVSPTERSKRTSRPGSTTRWGGFVRVGVDGQQTVG